MLFVLLILWPVAEVFAAIKVAEAIGAFWMLMLLVAGWPLGSWALRSQGGAAWRRLQAAVTEGRRPGREVLDGALVLLGGLLLIVPGFITDVLGACALLPPTRVVLRRQLGRHVQGRLVRSVAGRGRPPRAYDVDSTATDVEPPALRP